eukprot:Selendium_serpulae@DN6593_c0_g1_i1.p1
MHLEADVMVQLSPIRRLDCSVESKKRRMGQCSTAPDPLELCSPEYPTFSGLNHFRADSSSKAGVRGDLGRSVVVTKRSSDRRFVSTQNTTQRRTRESMTFDASGGGLAEIYGGKKRAENNAQTERSGLFHVKETPETEATSTGVTVNEDQNVSNNNILKKKNSTLKVAPLRGEVPTQGTNLSEDGDLILDSKCTSHSATRDRFESGEVGNGQGLRTRYAAQNDINKVNCLEGVCKNAQQNNKRGKVHTGKSSSVLVGLDEAILREPRPREKRKLSLAALEPPKDGTDQASGKRFVHPSSQLAAETQNDEPFYSTSECGEDIINFDSDSAQNLDSLEGDIG